MAYAQSQGWQAPQDGSGFDAYNMPHLGPGFGGDGPWYSAGPDIEVKAVDLDAITNYGGTVVNAPAVPGSSWFRNGNLSYFIYSNANFATGKNGDQVNIIVPGTSLGNGPTFNIRGFTSVQSTMTAWPASGDISLGGYSNTGGVTPSSAFNRVYIASSPGVPTGIPWYSDPANGEILGDWGVAVTPDTTNHRLYVWDGSWKPEGQYTGGSGIGCLETDNAGLWTVVPCGSGGTVTSVTGAGGLVCSPTSPNPTCTMDTFACSAGDFVSSASPGGLACTTPAYAHWSDGTFTPLPQEPLSTAGAGLAIADDPGDGATVISLPPVISAGSCTNCSIGYDLFGRIVSASSGSGGGVTSVTGTAQRVSTAPTTGAVVVDTIGGYYSGATSGGNEDLGTTLTNGLVCDTTTAGVAVLRTCTPGTDYQVPLSPGTGITFVGGTAVTSDLSTGIAGGQNAYGGTAATDNLVLNSNTSNGAKVVIGATNEWYFDEAAQTMIMGTSTPFSVATVQVNKSKNGGNAFFFTNPSTGGSAYDAFGLCTNAACSGAVFEMNLFGSGSSFGYPYQSNTAEMEISGGSRNMVFWVQQAAGNVDFAMGTTFPNPFVAASVAHGGGFLLPAIAAPSTPASGIGAIYVDSTSKNLAVKNDAGIVNHGVRTTTCGGSNWVNSIVDNGLVSCTQPAFTDVSGSATCAQLPAFTGDITKASGSCATVDTNKGKIYVDATDAAAHSPDYLYPKLTSFTNTISFSPIGTGDGQLTIDVVPLPTTSLSYFMNVAALTVLSTGWIATNDPTNFYASHVEYSPNYIVAHVTVTANLITNGIPVGPSITVVATRNGSNIIGATANFANGTATGVQTSGPIAISSGSASDVYGLSWGSGPASGNITVSFTLTLDAK